MSARRLLHRYLRKIGIDVIKSETLVQLEALRVFPEAIHRWSSMQGIPSLFQFIIERIEHSKGQLQQDLVAEYIFKSMPSSFNPTKNFVEFGAASGVALSNSYYLEKNLGWNGLLCEPSPNFHESIIKNRSASLDFRCVSSISNSKLKFRLTDNPELATLEEFVSADSHSDFRMKGQTIEVNTVSLDDLLNDWNFQNDLFYLSIDTEGSEYEILKEYSFRIKPSFLTVEHNFTNNEAKIDSLLDKHGYVRVLKNISLFDGWYVPKEVTYLAPELRLMTLH